MELYNTLRDTLVSLHENTKHTFRTKNDCMDLLPYACIPVYGVYLLNHRLNHLERSIKNDHEVNLIEDYQGTSYLYIGALAINLLALAIFPAVYFNSPLMLSVAQGFIGIGIIYLTNKTEKNVTEFKNQFELQITI